MLRTVQGEPIDACWDAPLGHAPLVFVDLEMTGTDPARDRICEVAALRGDRSFTSLVQVESAGASVRVHGLSDEMLRIAPPLAELDAALGEMIEGAILVGHRVELDLAFLAAARDRGELRAAPLHALDTHALAQRCLHTGAYGLRALCELICLPAPAHRALPDAIACRALFAEIAPRLRARTPRQLWQAQQHQRPPRMRDDVREALETCSAQGRCLRFAYRVPGRPPFEDELGPWTREGAHVQGWLRGRGMLRILRADRFLWAEPSETLLSAQEEGA